MTLTPTYRQRLWLSLIGIALCVFLLSGLLGGSVSLATSPSGTPSFWGAVVVVAICTVGWNIGNKVWVRGKLGLPLWRELTRRQARTLMEYRNYQVTKTITRPDDVDVARARRAVLTPWRTVQE